MRSPAAHAGRLFRFALVAGTALAAAGLLVDVAPTNLPIQLGGVTGGIALAYFGGGLTMVAATALAGRQVFVDASGPDRPQDGM
ncbi:hypothetical protein [Salinibacter grassmerensis]|uniref:hypothetical protein n=1 Tax=Salinibacter grassmerensis TaxID=3040353 RepID=UPI0021E740AF|nr:hypothetical protein [Salinibacter grassmerensis]